VTSGKSVPRNVFEKTTIFLPGIGAFPAFVMRSNVLRPINSVSYFANIAPKSISGSVTIQSSSPFGPAMYPSKLLATP
jgi:hypothetical protein